jgi:hypothetical protein
VRRSPHAALTSFGSAPRTNLEDQELAVGDLETDEPSIEFVT